MHAKPFRSLRRLAPAALAIVVMCGGGTRAAAETSASFDIGATIVAGCSVDGIGSSGNAGAIGTFDFGSDSSISTAMHSASLAATQSIRLRCTPGVSLAMSLDGGANASGGTRHLQHGSDSGARIAYSVCADAACTQPIAIGGASSMIVTPANSEDIRLPLYASLTLPGALPPGTYSDTLMVTLSW